MVKANGYPQQNPKYEGILTIKIQSSLISNSANPGPVTSRTFNVRKIVSVQIEID